MKNLSLSKLGVEEMNPTEMKKVQGGGLLGDLLSTVLGTVTTVANDTLQYAGKQVNTVFNLLSSLL